MRSRLASVALVVFTLTGLATTRAQEFTTFETQQRPPAQIVGTVIESAVINTPGGGVWNVGVGTTLLILGERDDWWQVEFSEPSLGKRVGWIQKRFVKVEARSAIPVIVEKPKATPTPSPSPRPPAAPAVQKTPVPTPKPAAPSSAQPVATPAQAASKKPMRLVFRGFFTYGLTSLAASQTYDALLNSSTVTAIGGGGEVGELWKHLFVRAGVGQTNTTGERALIIDGEVIGVGIPIEITMMPIEIMGGWRFTPKRKPKPGAAASSAGLHAPYSFYVGGGPVFFKYSETSEFAEATDNIDDLFTGFAFYGGMSVDLGRWVFVSGEGGYRTVPNGLGTGGLSAEFGETNLGGAVVRFMVGIRSKK